MNGLRLLSPSNVEFASSIDGMAVEVYAKTVPANYELAIN